MRKRVQVVLVSCDRCGIGVMEEVDGAFEIGPIVVAGKPKYADLCAGCQQDLQVATIRALLEDYGADTIQRAEARAGKTKPPLPSHQRMTCPQCAESLAGRGATINHLYGIHGVDRVKASHLVPPTRDARECTQCGMLCAGGLGLAKHLCVPQRAAS